MSESTVAGACGARTFPKFLTFFHARNIFGSRRGRFIFFLTLFVLYFLGVNGHWWYARDTVRYMGLARSLAENGTYSLNGSPHLFALPGFPLMLAGIYRLAGENFLLMNILMSLFGLGCIVMAFLLFDQLEMSLWEKAAAILLFAFSRTLYSYSRYLITDVPFTFTVITSLYFGVRMFKSSGFEKAKWTCFAIIASGAGCLIRPLGPVVVLSLAAAIWLCPGALKKWKSNLGWTAALAVLPALAVALWAYRSVMVGSDLGAGYFYRFIGNRGTEVVAWNIISRLPLCIGALSDAIFGTDLSLPVNILIFAVGVVGLAAAWRRGERLLNIFAVLYCVSICVATPSRRYLLPALPVLLYWLVLGTTSIGHYIARKRWLDSRRLSAIGIVLLVAAVLMNLARITKIVYIARTPDFYAAVDPGLKEQFELAAWLRREATAQDCVMIYDVTVVQYFGRVRISYFKGGIRRGDISEALHRIYDEDVSFLVRDAQDKVSAMAMDNLIQSRPWLFEKDRAFGNLQVYRVLREELEKRARNRGRSS